ncbi:MAG: threonine synthase [Propionibacteriales bacterium]|nr:threonine synthase [Propionibacteriales bacterium]
MRFSHLDHLECARCGTTYDANALQGLCQHDGSPLLARYDLAALDVEPTDINGRAPDLWRYHELLPVSTAEHIVTLGEGMTPLLPAPRLGAAIGLHRLLVKDDGLLPTSSFKARGAAVAVSRAKELGATRLAMPTNGNAGAAWSTYAARAGLHVTVAMPLDAPRITRSEVTVTGGDLRLVDGLISDAGRLIGAAIAASHDTWFDVSTLKEPYRIEGKKTIGLEIVEQLGWRMPDVIVYPTGGGVGLIGIYKALMELLELSWINGDLPRLVCVQSTGCAPIVTAFEAGARESVPVENSSTIAFGINVPKALGDFLVLDALSATHGTAVAVADSDLLADLRLAARLEGMFLCPEGAATVTATRMLAESGWIHPDDEVVLVNTGAGVIYPDTVEVDAPTISRDGPLHL